MEYSGVEIVQSQRKTVGRKFAPQYADPFAAIEVGIASLMFGCANHPLFSPFRRHHSKRYEIVLTGDFAKLGVEFNIYPEPRKRFEITAEALGGRVEDPVGRFRIVKPVAKRTIRARKRPIWRFPGIGAAADPEDRSAGINTERND
jgi:hypothetical protein